jgi:hypothetical protein
MYLATPAPLDYAAADTYEPIPGTWVGNELRFFTTSAAGVMTYSGPDNMVLLFVGSSDLEVSKTCTVYYALFKNGILLSTQQTPVEIEHPGHVYGMGITALVNLNSGDTLQIYSKSDDGAAVMTPRTLSVTFWGDHR